MRQMNGARTCVVSRFTEWLRNALRGIDVVRNKIKAFPQKKVAATSVGMGATHLSMLSDARRIDEALKLALLEKQVLRFGPAH